jgi:hypothetical protein
MEGRVTMKMRHTVGSVVIGLVALLGVASSGHAYASSEVVQVAPYQHTSDLVAGGMTDFCGFTIMRHDDFSGQIVLRYNQNGDLVSSLMTLHGTSTFSANGKSISGVDSGVRRDTFSRNGSEIYLGAGHFLWVVLPGVGPAWGTTGSFMLVLDAQGNVIREGDHVEDVTFTTTAVCAALAP